MVRAAIVLLILVLLPPAAHAQKRVALVIGNASYQHAGELTNPKNDANDMAAALRSAGFQVIEGYNLNKAALDRKIRDFAMALRGAQAGLFFYAGHGLQVSGQNYIVPVDAELTTEAALDFEMVRLDLVHRTMEREAPTNILFLDACRNNPLARNLARALGTRSAAIGRGLAAVESGAGTLISFSTQPGNVALDGAGRNSPFAGALVKHLSSSQDDLGSILIEVRNDVMEKTERKQVPWEHTAMTRRFYFKTAVDVAMPSTPLPQLNLSEAERTWLFVKDTQSVAVLESFIGRYPNTIFSDLARERLDKLKPTLTAPPYAPNPTTNSAAAPATQSTKTTTTTGLFNERNGMEASGIPAGQASFGQSIADCEQTCRRLMTCNVFTYNKKVGSCYVYTKADLVPNRDFDSGIRRSAEPSDPLKFTIRNGLEASGIPAGQASFSQSIANCQRACEQSGACRIFTYNKTAGSCYIYTRATAFTPNTQFDSGIRD
jgi:Caspase domain/PAN domain